MPRHLHAAGNCPPFNHWVAAIKSEAFCLREQFKRDIDRYGLAGEAGAMLLSTIDLVAANVAMRMQDGVPYADLLRGQYPSSRDESFPYRIVFDLGAAGAVFRCDAGLMEIDLADLYRFPWDRLTRVGFRGFWVERAGGGVLPEVEVDRLVALIKADFDFDYSAGELSVQFDAQGWPGVLHCQVSDLRAGDEE